MSLKFNNKLKIIFDEKFYNREHMLWGNFEDGRIVDASEIASKATILLKTAVHVRPIDPEKRKYAFYTKAGTIGSIYFGKPEEHYVEAEASDTNLYYAIFEKVLKTSSASGHYPLALKITGNITSPLQIVIGMLSRKYLNAHIDVLKGNIEHVGYVEEIPKTLFENIIRKYTLYGVIVANKVENEYKILPSIYTPPNHVIPLMPKACPIGFIIGVTPNLTDWLVFHYDPLGVYGIEYHELQSNYSFRKIWSLMFLERELGEFKLVKVDGKFKVKTWMTTIKDTIKNNMRLEEILSKDHFNTNEPYVFSTFFMIPVRKIKKNLEESEVYIYSRYWPYPKLVRLFFRIDLDPAQAGLNWVKHVNLTPSMKWSKVWSHWKGLGKISLITACVLSVLKG